MDFDFELRPETPDEATAPLPHSVADPALRLPGSVPKRRKRSGFYVRFDDRGGLAWEQLEPEERRRLQAALTQASEQVIRFSPPEAAALYQILGEVEALAATLLARCPIDMSRRVWSYTAAEAGMLAEPTAKVMSKWAGPWVQQHKDEMMLLLVLVSIHQRKMYDFFRVLKEWRAERDKPAIGPNGRLAEESGLGPMPQ